MSTLRLRLREETRDAHESVDALFGQHDLSTREGLATTLQAHSVALRRTLAALPDPASPHAHTLVTMITAIEQDLAALDARPSVACQIDADDTRIHPLGLIYVIAGSRLGARILLAEIRASSDPVVAAATRYFTCPQSEDMWKSVSNTLKVWTGPADEEKEIIASARTAFTWFEAAHRTVQKASTPV